MEVAPPVISKIRHGRLPVGASLLIRMHEETGMNIGELRDLMGDRRKKYRLAMRRENRRRLSPRGNDIKYERQREEFDGSLLRARRGSSVCQAYRNFGIASPPGDDQTS